MQIEIKSNPVTQQLINDELEVLDLLVESGADDQSIEEQSERISYLQMALNIRSSVLSCKSCALRRMCKGPVPLQGSTVNPSIIALGEAPGESEDRQGIGFCGVSGILLRTSAAKVGVEIEDYVNTVACRPPANRTPSTLEVKSCSQNLRDQVELMNPFLILCFGATALSAATGNSNLKITKDHGVLFRTVWNDPSGQPIWGYGMLHPSYILRAISFLKSPESMDPEKRNEVERSRLSIIKWGENWEFIGKVMQLKNLFNAKMIFSFGEDLRTKNESAAREMVKAQMDESSRGENTYKPGRGVYLDKLDKGILDEIEEIPF